MGYFGIYIYLFFIIPKHFYFQRKRSDFCDGSYK